MAWARLARTSVLKPCTAPLRRGSKNLGWYYRALAARDGEAPNRIPPVFPAEPITGVPRKRAFIEFKMPEDIKAKRVEIELADDIVPETVANFLQLCAGSAEAKTGYIGSQVHRVRPGLGVEFGDFERGDGRGGFAPVAETGPYMAEENLVGRHSEPGVLSFIPAGVDRVASVVLITTSPASHLDGRQVVFGKVLSGLQHVEAMLTVFNAQGVPTAPIEIAAAGELQ